MLALPREGKDGDDGKVKSLSPRLESGLQNTSSSKNCCQTFRFKNKYPKGSVCFTSFLYTRKAKSVFPSAANTTFHFLTSSVIAEVAAYFKKKLSHDHTVS